MSDAVGLAVVLGQSTPTPLAVELACAPGETLALVGPSGSGKTTVLKCIAGLRKPQSGRVTCGSETWLDREQGIDVRAQHRSVGLVFQNYALFPHLSAQHNVMLALEHLPAAERAGRARALLETVHLGGLEERRPAELSGGQQQRVAVARALARDPRVLLLDEPFAAVDRVTRHKLHRELAELRRSLRIPIVLVTHDLDEAAMLADRMTLLHHGRTLQHGTPQEVMTRPASPLVARLVDLRNVFDARVQAADPQSATLLLDWNGIPLTAGFDPRFAPGSQVAWTIPGGQVLMHRRDRPSRGERENPVDGVVAEALVLGETTSITMSVQSTPRASLQFPVPTHVAGRNGIGVGATIRVSLLSEGIHLMPPGRGDAGDERRRSRELREL